MQPLQYLTTAGGMIWTAACVLLGVLLTWLSYRLINRIPATWLCDYNETPSAELLSGKRVSFTKSGIVMSIVAAACLFACRLQFNRGFDIYFIVFALIIVVCLMIAVCDLKYTIIPDQFTVALAVLGLSISIYDLIRGFGILHKAWWSPLAGAALGAGAMILIDLIGMLIYKRTGMGFGDVKLFAAVGLITGFPGTILAFIISMITGMLFFIGILLAAKIIGKKASVETEPADKADSAKPESPISAASAETESADKQEAVKAASADDEAGGLPRQDETGDVQQSSAEEEAPEQQEEQKKGGSYLAFGPYIALALVCYLCFYDLIYRLVESYLNLF